jgi:hypothetical protein
MSRFDEGWIKVHRSILDNAVSQRGLFTFGIFIKLLYMANWKESKIIFGGQKMTLKPGQLVTGLKELSPDRDEDPYLNKVRASLDYLHLCEAIQQVTNNQGRLITICNWDKYQSSDEEELTISTSEEQLPHKQSTSEPQLSEEGKKERKNTGNVFDFESIYKIYPRKQGKSEGFKKLAKEIKTEADFNLFCSAVRRYVSSKAGTDRQYILKFSNFVKEWNDWTDTVGAASGESQLQLGTLEDLQKVGA